MRILLLIGAFAFLSFPLEAQGNLEYLRYQFQYFGDPPLLAVSINTREEMARLYARWKQNPEKTAAFCLYGELEQFELGDSTLVLFPSLIWLLRKNLLINVGEAAFWAPVSLYQSVFLLKK